MPDEGGTGLPGGWPPQAPCNPEMRGTAREALCYNRNLQGGFLQSIFPCEDSGYSTESQETQFLVSLLLPGLSRLRTVNGAKQKQKGPGVGPHKRQREGKE